MPQTDASINDPTRVLRRAAERALDVLLPPECPACGTQVDGAAMLCPECWRQVTFLGPPHCDACGLPFEHELPEGALCGACTRERPAFARARAVMAYGAVSRRIVLSFKHGDRTDTAPTLGLWMARAGTALVAAADVIAPVPLHWTRLFQRRYNQAAMLALVLGRETGVPVEPDLLVRKRRTQSLGHMGPARRRRTLRGAFRVHPGRKDGLPGRRLLLVDDVLTTGATASACARTLLREGAAAVDVLTLARVVRASEAGR